MRPIRLALQLTAEGKTSKRQVSIRCRISPRTLDEYEMRFREAGLSWPLPSDLDDAALEERLFPTELRRVSRFPLPDWGYIQQQMNSYKGATLKVLHEEYLKQFPEGMQYVRFCQLYRLHVKKQKVTLRASYEPGSVVFVDYAGRTVTIASSQGDAEFQAQIFVAVLGASGLVYAEATRSQQLPDWLASHQRMFRRLGGTLRTVVCDNLKSAVAIASYKGEPVLNEAYAELAAHYGVNVVPARPKHPQDKGKVEQAVQMVTRLLFKFRNRSFESLNNLNLALSELVDQINRKPVLRTGVSREQSFASCEQDELGALPRTAWEYSVYRHLRVETDYHIEFERYRYSVPYFLVGEQVEIRATAGIIDISHKGKHIASHVRSYGQRVTTEPNHRHPNHEAYLNWDPQQALCAAAAIGPCCRAFLEAKFAEDKHIDHRRRVSQSLQGMSLEYSAQRLEAACNRALSAGAHEVMFIRNILRNRREMQLATGTDDGGVIRKHTNLRSTSEFELHLVPGGKAK